MDTVIPSVRSAIMAKVRSKGNRTTERRLRALLVGAGVRGWRTNVRTIAGTPDVAFERKRLAVFVDGCFWHGCPKCYRRPKSKRKFWDAKVAQNRVRDRRVTRQLKKEGWSVIRLYECKVGANLRNLLGRIRNQLATPCAPRRSPRVRAGDRVS